MDSVASLPQSSFKLNTSGKNWKVSQFNQAKICEAKKEFNQAAEAYRSVANKTNDPEARYKQACIHLDHEFPQKNTGEAMDLLRRATDQKFSPAMCKLGFAYAKQNNLNDAAFYFARAIDSGNTEGYRGLTMVYTLEQKSSEAHESFEQLKSLADQGNSEAQLQTGLCYLEASGVAADHEQGKRYLTLAADAGNETALLHLENLGTQKVNPKGEAQVAPPCPPPPPPSPNKPFAAAQFQNPPLTGNLLAQLATRGSALRTTEINVKKNAALPIVRMITEGHPPKVPMGEGTDKIVITDEIEKAVQLTQKKSLRDEIAAYNKTGLRLPLERTIYQLSIYKNQKTLIDNGIDQKNITVICDKMLAHMNEQTPVPLFDAEPQIIELVGQQTADKLKVASGFVCTNGSVYAPKLHPKNTETHAYFQNRQAAYLRKPVDGLEDYLKVLKSSSTVGPTGSTWAQLESSASALKQTKGAVCTNFTQYAAHELITEAKSNPNSPIRRVECLSGADHCYVVINREDSGKEVLRPGKTVRVPPAGINPETKQPMWGNKAVIVDIWAGTLGFPVFYTDPRDYPPALQKYISEEINQDFIWDREAEKGKLQDMDRFANHMAPSTIENLKALTGATEAEINEFQSVIQENHLHSRTMPLETDINKLEDLKFVKAWKQAVGKNPQLINLFGWGESINKFISTPSRAEATEDRGFVKTDGKKPVISL